MLSYTAHYAVTALGKVLPTLFVCKKEAMHLFLAFVQKWKH